MGSKGSKTVNQTQTYTPNPVAGQAIQGALGQVQNVSQTPFQTPVAPVQGFSQDQQRAFDLTNQAQGVGQPLFQQAANYFSPNGASQFFNPMAGNVMAGMQDIFGQQMKQTTGNLIGQAGGVGGDRIAVGQSELGRQQGLAAGQTLSDMYNRAAQQAQGAAFGLGSLAPAMQNTQLQGAQALLGTGGLQQQLGQAQLNAPYQNILQRIQWPYQNAQFNATNTAALAPGLGGTTNGGTTYPGASPWGTIAGIGAAGLGAYGGAGGFSGKGSNVPADPYVNADTDPSLIGARGGRVPERAYGGAVPGYDEGGEVDNSLFKNSSIDDPMVSEAPMGGMGSDLIPHEQIQGIKPVIPQLPQPQQGGGGKGSGGSDWGKAIGTAAKIAMSFVNRGGRVPEGYADGGAAQPGGFGSPKGGGMGGLMSMFGGGPPSAASVMQHMMQMPGGPPSAASMVQRMPQMSGMFGHGMFGGHAFDPRSYMRPRASGGVVGYADGGAPEGYIPPEQDELVQPPYDSRAVARSIFPNATSLLGGEKEVPPPQIEGMAPGKTRSFDDPRLMGVVPEMAAASAMAMPAGEMAMLARPGVSAAREALEQAPGIVDKTLAGSGAARTMTNPIPSIMQGARPIGGGALLAGVSGDALAQTPEEKTEIGALESQIGKLKADIARLRNNNKDDAIFNLRSSKPRSDLGIAEAKLKTINARIEKRKEGMEALNLEQLRKTTEAEEPFRVAFPQLAKNLPIYSAAGALGLGTLGGLLNKGKAGRSTAIGFGAGLGEGALTSMGPTLYDMGSLPLGSKYQKEASDQIWGPLHGNWDYYKNRVTGEAGLNAGIGGLGGYVGAYGPKIAGKVGDVAGKVGDVVSRMFRPAARAMAPAAGPVEGTIAKAAAPVAAPAESAVASAAGKTKYVISEHKLADGSTVNRYINPNNPNDVRWRIPGSRTWLKKGDYPKLEKEARGGRVSGNPYAFDEGGDVPWEANNKWTPELNDRWNALSDPFPSELPENRTPLPRPRPQVDDVITPNRVRTLAFKPEADPDEPPTPPQAPMGGGNPYSAPPQVGGQGGQPQGGRFIDSPWAALMNAGLGMMAASGKRDARGLPTPPLAAIGEGGLQGLQTLGQQRDAAMKQQGIDRQVAALNQSMRHQQEQMDLARAKPVIGPPDENGMRPVYRYNPATRRYEDDSGNAQGTPATPPGAPRGGLQKVNLDEGILTAHAQVMKEPYNYSKDAPYLEKGMDVPEPEPVGGKSSRALQTDAEYYLQTGKLPPVARGQSPVAIQQARYRDAVQNYGNAVASSRGLSPEQMTDMWRTAPGVLRFVLGADGRSTVALGTAVRHLETVRELAKAWAANDQPLISRLRAILGREFGEAAGTNLTTAGRIVGPEIIKAIGVAGAGTAEERHAAQLAFSTAASPEQMLGAIDTTQKLLGGQLEGRKRQAMAAGVSEKKFRSLVGERPYQLLSEAEKEGKGAPAAAPAARPAQPAGQEGEMRQFKQGWGIFRNGKWQPYQDQGPRL